MLGVPLESTMPVYTSFDLNGDGEVSYSELQALLKGSAERHPRLFAHARRAACHGASERRRGGIVRV